MPYIIGFACGSDGGKSTLSDALKEKLTIAGKTVRSIKMDG